ncbi:MAG: hypothetical protein INH41_02960 [Myxococcaceae bacterium]|jgi:hypothetical protein|nr:hypothetical protein [Myxococcaceae bacterium]MCA3011340.1 hypothetical protein [Myxococcaceae bacterium]
MDRDAAKRSLMVRVTEGAGVAAAGWRQAAWRGEGAALPEGLGMLVERMRTRAHDITDDEVAALRQTYADDVLFEVMVAAALGAADETRAAGLSVLEDD